MRNLLDYNISIIDDKTIFIGDCHMHFANFLSFIEYILFKRYNKIWTNIIAVGLATETISGLSEPNHKGRRGVIHKRPCIHDRLDRIVSDMRPSTIFSCYGMTDGLFMQYDEKRFEAFKHGTMMLIEKCRQYDIKLVIITPPIYEETSNFRYDTDVLCTYSKWLCELRNDEYCYIIDLHSKMLDFHSKNKPMDKELFMTGDKIHWTMETHMFVAKTILDNIGIDTSEYNLSDTNKIVQTDIFKRLFDCRVKRTSGWLKYIGYKREESFDYGSVDIVSIESDVVRAMRSIVM